MYVVSLPSHLFEYLIEEKKMFNGCAYLALQLKTLKSKSLAQFVNEVIVIALYRAD